MGRTQGLQKTQEWRASTSVEGHRCWGPCRASRVPATRACELGAPDLRHGGAYPGLEQVGDALAEAADFRATGNIEPHGPDLLIAVAAYMDRKDDEAEARGDVKKADRTVQTDLVRWAVDLGAARARWKEVTG